MSGWNTIESDAGVFTYLLQNLGAKDVQFEELVSLDPDSLRQLSPIHGVIFLFKYPSGGGDAASQRRDQQRDGTYDHSIAENDPNFFFAAQTIQNACGTQALLSVLLNKDKELEIGSTLKEFKEFTTGFPPEFRGEALSNSEVIRSVHNSFARSNPFIDETQRTATEDDDVYHFIAYSCINGKLYELDGLQPAPISHGDCTPDSFPDAVIPVLQRRISRYPAGEIRFNLLAMVRDPRIHAREIGDMESLQREQHKRGEWQWENALRKHNFVGFIGELLKGVVSAKLEQGGDAAYDAWLDEAKAKTKKRVQERSKAGGAVDEMDV